MSSFGGLLFTTAGRNLQAKAQAGAQLTFTRIAIGDGDLGGTAIADLTALKHQVKSLSITKLKTMAGGNAVVGTTFTNQDVVVGFYWKELGVFAQDPDLGEVLYCYGNAGVNAEYIPSSGGADIIEKSVDVVTIIGNASNVTATVDNSLIFVTVLDFNSHIENNVIHVLQTDRDSWNAKETPAGAQAKADAVQNNLTTHIGSSASLTSKGHVQLSSATDSSDETLAATPKAVKAISDLLNTKQAPLSIKTGTISHGGTIPQTPGYTNYKYFVSINNVTYGDNVSGSYATHPISCSVNQSTRLVTCHAEATNYSTNYDYAGIANYIEIAW